MYKKAQVFLLLSAAILLVYAVIFLINPLLLGHLIGFSSHSPNTPVEITAFYGGLELGVALYLVWSTKTIKRTRHALMMMFFVFLAAGLARFFGIIRFGFEDPSQPIVASIEVSWSVAAWWIANKIRHS